jgi:predicted dehydrogenase
MIGAGAFAKAVLLPILKRTRGVDLATICTATGLSAQSTAKKFGFAACTTDLEGIFDDPQINAVMIATRHHLHAPLAIRALQAGKHVFVEKPLALDEDQLHTLLKTVNSESSARLMVGFNRRFAPLTQRVKEVYEARGGPLAIHYRVNAGHVPPEHWVHDSQEGGGRIIGEVCHFVDWMHYLTGVAPRHVYTQALPAGGRHIAEDNVLITVTFADGSVGSIHYLANGDPRLPKERIEVFGSGAVAIVEDFQSAYVIQQGKRTKLGGRLWSRQDKGHAAELQAFIAAVETGGDAPIPFDSAALVTLTTFRIRDSLRENMPMPIDLGILSTALTIPGL